MLERQMNTPEGANMPKINKNHSLRTFDKFYQKQ